MSIAEQELQKLLAQQQAISSDPIIGQIAEGQNIARPGDIQRAGGLLSGIGARGRLREQQQFNTEQNIAGGIAEGQRQDQIGDSLFALATADRLDNPEAVAAGNYLLDQPDARVATLDLIKQARERATVTGEAPPTPREIEDMARDTGASIMAMRDKAQEPLFIQQEAGRSIITNLEQGTGFGDTASVFGLFTFLDPGSRVTEGEIRLSEGASAPAQQALALINRIGGASGKFTPEARAEMAQILYAQQGHIAQQMIRNNEHFNNTLGATLAGAFEASTEQAMAISQSRFFRPDAVLPTLDAGRSPPPVTAPVINDDGTETIQTNVGERRLVRD